MIEENANTLGSTNHLIRVGAGAVTLDGVISIPPNAHGLVILPRSFESDEFRAYLTTIALSLNQQELATLQVEMFTPEEKTLEGMTDYFGQNTDIMQQRFIAMADWLLEQEETKNFSIGYFGAGPIGAGALIAAAERPDNVRAVVSAGGNVGLVQTKIGDIVAAILLIGAENDTESVRANQELLAELKGQKELEVVAGVQNLFSEQHSIDEVIRLASAWFARWLVTIL
jgi:putative phosphoribosyl transferase